ncbi:hypothetical protein AGMMS49525_15510 [Bacteroidia bacterium]|nr:hypothetical protein AGMMS49525_15510 [Bacteroidia bacterium]
MIAFGGCNLDAVQFLIITFGSIGIIPLTGIVVPFVSYGRVSMIFNLAAFGIVLSLSQLEGKKIEKEYIQKNYDEKSTRPAILTILGFTVFLLCVLFKYQFIQRNDILIKPALVTNRSGERFAEYNPRINILIKNMNAGNIYDRNGLLLATNDKNEMRNIKRELAEKDEDLFKIVEENISNETHLLGKRRFYPFGNNTFFWTGNYNTRLLWDDGEDARGYIAERRHLAYLRGFDTQPQKDMPADTLLYAHNFIANRFLPRQEQDSIKCKLYDYTELISFLKQGKNSSKLKMYNEKREKRDIKLTVDAKLQTELQNALKKANLEKNMRTSVVVLDAKNGEILSSANYPLPDQTDLKAKYDDINYKDYKDYITTNRDLGLTWATNPGSTAKLMSSLAWFRKQESTHRNEPIKTYNIDMEEILDFNNRTGMPAEPYNKRNDVPLRQTEGNMGKIHQITMQEAIVLSSNVYFIKLVNDQNLYSQLSDIYSLAGLRLGHKHDTYTFYNDRKSSLKKKMEDMESRGTNKYRNYVDNLSKGGGLHKLRDSEYMITWGEDPLEATPLAMARVVSAIINNGKLVDTKYVLTEELLKKLPKQQSTEMVSSDNSKILQGFMKEESQKRPTKLPQVIGGKSGTPTRIISGLGRKNDGWYVFFVEPTEKSKKTLAVAVRIELGGTSDKAYQVVANQLTDILINFANN